MKTPGRWFAVLLLLSLTGCGYRPVGSEPVGGAHRAPDRVIGMTGDVIATALAELTPIPGDQLRTDRRQKFLDIGRNL